MRKTQELQARYETVLFNARVAGDLVEVELADNKRAHPRFSMEYTPILGGEVGMKALDISVSGMGIWSPATQNIGDALKIEFPGISVFGGTVMHCRPEHPKLYGVEPQYVIGCEFLDPIAGMALLVALKEAEQEAEDAWLDKVLLGIG